MHPLDRVDNCGSMFARGGELVPGTKLVEKGGSWSFPNAHGAVALHIAMTANWTSTATLFSDISAKQQKVGHLSDGCHSVFMLSQPHCPAADDALGVHRDFGSLPDLLAAEAAVLDDLIPFSTFEGLDQFFVAARVFFDELEIENFTGSLSFLRKQLLHKTFEECQVAVDLDRQPKIGKLSTASDQCS